AFDREMRVHAAIGRRFGYKISVHSGSDKFRVFPSIAKHTRGRFHVKTAGTNWLEAMRAVAETDPALYRRAHAFALEHFDEARAYYHVSARAEAVPPLDSLADAQLPGLFDQADARQLIHITYGLILSQPELKKALYDLWDREAEAYAARLESHIGRHMRDLGVPER
ncbi:MAG TPA: tagaturonate epimerase family protein, partial [Candidatus Limnocylindria bacterium]|nr:tagaturonate epimerase family protein [Candidatus Limnocylindria bacterium]